MEVTHGDDGGGDSERVADLVRVDTSGAAPRKEQRG
jgi:hypothetical protein